MHRCVFAGTKANLEHTQAETNYLNAHALSLKGAKPERQPNEVELALIAADPNDQRAARAQAALERLGKGKHNDVEPKTFPEMVLARELETDPDKKQRLDNAIRVLTNYHDRPTKSESDASQDRQLKRDAISVLGKALASAGGNQDQAMATLTRALANGENLSERESMVLSHAIVMARQRPSIWDELAGLGINKPNADTKSGTPARPQGW